MANKTRGVKRLSADAILDAIKNNLTRREQNRLGLLLATKNALPGWRVVRARSLCAVTQEGLSGYQAMLYNALFPEGSTHDEMEVMRKLWPDDAFAARINPSFLVVIQDRLRQLQRRTNQQLELLDGGFRSVRRRPEGKKLYVYLEYRNRVEKDQDLGLI